MSRGIKTGVERYRDSCRALKTLKNAAIERCPGVHNKASLMDRGCIEELSRRQEISRSIHLAIERCQDCDEKQQMSSIDKPGVERCRGAVEIV